MSVSEEEDLGCHWAVSGPATNSLWEPCLDKILCKDRVSRSLRGLGNSDLFLCVSFFPSSKHRLYLKPSPAPDFQLMPPKAAPAQLALATSSCAWIPYSSCPSPCHLSPGDLFVPSCCHILIYSIAADGRALPGFSAPGKLYSVAKVITSSREQEVNSRLLSSAWTRHKFSVESTVQAAATQYRNK